jgi:hypothetical protein
MSSTPRESRVRKDMPKTAIAFGGKPTLASLFSSLGNSLNTNTKRVFLATVLSAPWPGLPACQA